jgi:hypothetical protein
VARTATRPDDRALLLRVVEEAYDRSTWNGTNLRSSIRRLAPGVVDWKADGARHDIVEIVLHCAYWKYAVRRRLTGEKRGSFALPGTDWFTPERPLAPAAWKRAVALLDDEHERLCEAIASARAGLRYASRNRREHARQLFGVAMHDAYHTGQVNLIKSMHKRREAD